MRLSCVYLQQGNKRNPEKPIGNKPINTSTFTVDVWKEW